MDDFFFSLENKSFLLHHHLSTLPQKLVGFLFQIVLFWTWCYKIQNENYKTWRPCIKDFINVKIQTHTK